MALRSVAWVRFRRQRGQVPVPTAIWSRWASRLRLQLQLAPCPVCQRPPAVTQWHREGCGRCVAEIQKQSMVERCQDFNWCLKSVHEIQLHADVEKINRWISSFSFLWPIIICGVICQLNYGSSSDNAQERTWKTSCTDTSTHFHPAKTCALTVFYTRVVAFIFCKLPVPFFPSACVCPVIC